METMTTYILAAALGIAIAVAMYLYSELSFERTVSASKTATNNEQDKTIKVMYDKIMRMHKTLDSNARLIESLYDERRKLKKDCEYYKGVANGREVLIHDLEAKLKKANTVSNHTYTINVDSDKLAKEVMKQIREKYGRNFQ